MAREGYRQNTRRKGKSCCSLVSRPRRRRGPCRARVARLRRPEPLGDGGDFKVSAKGEGTGIVGLTGYERGALANQPVSVMYGPGTSESDRTLLEQALLTSGLNPPAALHSFASATTRLKFAGATRLAHRTMNDVCKMRGGEPELFEQ